MEEKKGGGARESQTEGVESGVKDTAPHKDVRDLRQHLFRRDGDKKKIHTTTSKEREPCRGRQGENRSETEETRRIGPGKKKKKKTQKNTRGGGGGEAKTGKHQEKNNIVTSSQVRGGLSF